MKIGNAAETVSTVAFPAVVWIFCPPIAIATPEVNEDTFFAGNLKGGEWRQCVAPTAL